MALRGRSILAGLWLALAFGVALYTSWHWSNTALDISAFYGEGQILALSYLGYGCTVFCLLMAILYWYSPRLDRPVLNWLHFLGTLATLLLAWQVVGLALEGGLPGTYYSGTAEFAEELARQQAQVMTFQVRAVLFLFVVSQLLFVINWLTVAEKEEEDDIDKMLDQLLDSE